MKLLKFSEWIKKMAGGDAIPVRKNGKVIPPGPDAQWQGNPNSMIRPKRKSTHL